MARGRHGQAHGSSGSLGERPYLEVPAQWSGDDQLLGGRRSRRGRQYTAYIPAGIADWEPALSSSVAAQLQQAERDTFDLNHDPPGIATLDALARQLLRAEAVASSRIEGFQMSHRRLARAQAAPGHNALADQIIGNINAMERAISIGATAATITPASICDVHNTLLKGTQDEPIGGVIRTRQNWVGGEASSPLNAEFVPPPPDRVPELVDDLCAFMMRDDIPPALQAAITHAQFETIHPFMDGNGRVGRALIHVVLRRREIATPSAPPISLALAADADRYVKGLTSYRYGDPEDWFTVFAEALDHAAVAARGFARDVGALQGRWRDQAGSPRRNSSASRLIALLPEHPVLTVNQAASLLGVSAEAARKALIQLEGADVVKERTAGKRNRVWESVGLFDLLDSFERTVGPPARAPHPTR